MGAAGQKSSGTGYDRSKYDEENELRQFELECGAFKKNLNNILPKISIENKYINIKNFDSFILSEFNENLQKLISHEFFYAYKNEKKFYDAKKIHLLLFLLSKHSLVKNTRYSYYDKSSFFISYVKNSEEETLNEPIMSTEKNFVEFVNDIFDIACVGIVDGFYRIKRIQRDGLLIKLRKYKEHIVEAIIKSLFVVRSKSESEDIGFKDLNEKFKNDAYFFTSGFLREIAFENLKKNLGEYEKLEQERSKQEEEMKMKN